MSFRLSAARTTSVIGFFALAAGCGGAPAVTQAPSVAVAPEAGARPSPPIDLGPIDPPATLVLTAHASNVASSLAVVGDWTKLPMPQSEQLSAMLFGAEDSIGPLVDLDKPVDAALALADASEHVGLHAPHVLAAVSVALHGFDEAKAALSSRYKLVPGDGGVLLVTGLSGPKGDDDDGDESPKRRACEIAPAFGPAKARLVCAFGNAEALSRLGPWLTRGATRIASTADVAVDLRMAPIRSYVTEGRRLATAFLGNLGSDAVSAPSVRDLALAFVQDIADYGIDLEGLTLEARLTDPSARLVMTQRIATTASVTSRLVLAHADPVGPPPGAFWQMPSDADFAFFGRGFDPALLAPARDRLLHALSDALEQAKVKADDRKAVVDALSQIAVDPPSVYASGADLDAATKALAAMASAPSTSRPSGPLVAALLGWHVLETNEGPATVASTLKALAGVLRRPGIVKALRAAGGDTLAVALRTAPLPKGPAWPAGSEHDVLDVRAPSGDGPHPAARSMAFHLFLVPDGARSWIGWGADEALVAQRLRAAVVGSGQTLGSLGELASLKTASVGGGGFFTSRGSALEGLGIAALSDLPIDTIGSTLDDLKRLPSGGLTPIVTTTTPTAGSPSTLVTTVDLPRAVIDDAVGWVMRHLGP